MIRRPRWCTKQKEMSLAFYIIIEPNSQKTFSLLQAKDLKTKEIKSTDLFLVRSRIIAKIKIYFANTIMICETP